MLTLPQTVYFPSTVKRHISYSPEGTQIHTLNGYTQPGQEWHARAARTVLRHSTEVQWNLILDTLINKCRSLTDLDANKARIYKINFINNHTLPTYSIYTHRVYNTANEPSNTLKMCGQSYQTALLTRQAADCGTQLRRL